MGKSESNAVRIRTKQGPKKSAAELLSEFLNGLYDTKPIDRVTADTGIAWGTVKKYVEGRATPGMENFIRLVVAYGPEYLAAVCPKLRWLSDAYISEMEAKLTADILALERRRGQLR